MLITDQRPGETNILAGYETEDFIIKALGTEEVLFRFPAPGVWTHEKLVDVLSALCAEVRAIGGADYWVGPIWAGDTEV
jgi:hypothetical protein